MANQTKPNDQLFGDYLAIIKASKPYKWYRETERLLRQFQTFIGQFPSTLELFTDFFQHYNVPSIRQSTRARYYYVFSAFFKWYDGSSLPFKVKSPKPVPQKVSDEEVEKLKEAIRGHQAHKKLIKRDILIIELFCHTGLRRAELANLTIADLRLGGESPHLIVRQGKGGKDRTVNLNDHICSCLKSFTKGMTPQMSVFGIASKTVASIFGVWAKKAGVPQLHPHSLRHKFATDILNRGGNIRDLKYLMGHESLGTTESYLAVTDDNLKKAVRLLDKSTPLESATPKGTKDSKNLQDIKESVDDIKKHLGVETENTDDNETYFDLSVVSDRDGNMAGIKVSGAVPVGKAANALAKFVSKRVKLKKETKDA